MGEPEQLCHEAVLGRVVEVQVALVLQGRPQQGGGQLEDLEQLRVPETGGDLTVLRQAAARVSLEEQEIEEQKVEEQEEKE